MDHGLIMQKYMLFIMQKYHLIIILIIIAIVIIAHAQTCYACSDMLPSDGVLF